MPACIISYNNKSSRSRRTIMCPRVDLQRQLSIGNYEVVFVHFMNPWMCRCDRAIIQL